MGCAITLNALQHPADGLGTLDSMRDLTNRALDTATALGASYADVRVVRRLDESINIKSGRVEGVSSGETEGFGVRVIVDGAWGFAASHHLSTGEADRVAAQAVRIAKASATAIRTPVRLDDRPPSHGSFESPVGEDPFAMPLDRKIADLLAADRAMNRVKGDRLHRVDLLGPARVEDLRRQRRQLHGAGHHPHRQRAGGERHRGRRAPAAELPRQRRRLWASAGTSSSGRWAWRPTRSGSRARPSSC